MNIRKGGLLINSKRKEFFFIGLKNRMFRLIEYKCIKQKLTSQIFICLLFPSAKLIGQIPSGRLEKAEVDTSVIAMLKKKPVPGKGHASGVLKNKKSIFAQNA